MLKLQSNGICRMEVSDPVSDHVRDHVTDHVKAAKTFAAGACSLCKIDFRVESLLYEVTNDDLAASKGVFSYMCSYLFNCTDIDRIMDKLTGHGFLWDDNSPYGERTRKAFHVCAEHIQANLLTDKPWKISEEYISGLGEKFLLFRTMNSVYLSGGNLIG